VLFPVGVVLAFVLICGTKVWVDFGSPSVVTHRAFFGFLNLFLWHFRCLCYIRRKNSFCAILGVFSFTKYFTCL